MAKIVVKKNPELAKRGQALGSVNVFRKYAEKVWKVKDKEIHIICRSGTYNFGKIMQIIKMRQNFNSCIYEITLDKDDRD